MINKVINGLSLVVELVNTLLCGQIIDFIMISNNQIILSNQMALFQLPTSQYANKRSSRPELISLTIILENE